MTQMLPPLNTISNSIPFYFLSLLSIFPFPIALITTLLNILTLPVQVHSTLSTLLCALGKKALWSVTIGFLTSGFPFRFCLWEMPSRDRRVGENEVVISITQLHPTVIFQQLPCSYPMTLILLHLSPGSSNFSLPMPLKAKLWCLLIPLLSLGS